VSGSSPQRVLVYDVGGSHISAAVCEEETFVLHGISRAPLPNQESAHFSAASFGRLVQTLGEAATRFSQDGLSRIAGAALAMPGPFDYDRGISTMKHKLQSLYGVDLKAALAPRFCWQPGQVQFVNDAAAFLLGEAAVGAAKGFHRAIGLTLGTGIGCAFAVDGRIVVGGPGGEPGVPPGGEIWNLPFNGATVEDFVSTRFLRHQYQVLTGVQADVSAIADAAKGDPPCPDVDIQPEDETGARRITAQIVDGAMRQARSGRGAASPLDSYEAHCRAREAFVGFGRYLGLALSEHAAAFDPDVIVIGGGIARASLLFLPATREALNGMRAKLAISQLMDDAPLVGAGVHWFRNANKST